MVLSIDNDGKRKRIPQYTMAAKAYRRILCDKFGQYITMFSGSQS